MKYLKNFLQWVFNNYTLSPVAQALPLHKEKLPFAKGKIEKPSLINQSMLHSLKTFCQSPIADYSALRAVGFKEYDTGEDGMKYWFLDRGSKVLAVAHLDFVSDANTFGYLYTKDDRREVVLSPQLDDRLGVWLICDVLYNLGYDILLTEGEESGKSTARYFSDKRDYNWIFSFDRRGTDVVSYQYDSPQMKNLLLAFDFTPGHGSFSDICYLERLGVKGFNFGCGYYDNHSADAYAIIDETIKMASKFIIFFENLKDKRMWHKNSHYRSYKTKKANSNGFTYSV